MKLQSCSVLTAEGPAIKDVPAEGEEVPPKGTHRDRGGPGEKEVPKNFN